MRNKIIYLNNAGTSWPKPAKVEEAVQHFYASSPENWPQVFTDSLQTVTSFFKIQDRSRFLFTSGCTSALAILLSDFPWKEGDQVITSGLEHHALARWLVKLPQQRGVDLQIAPYSAENPIDLEFIEKELKKGKTRLIACTMASNVTGDILPVAEIIALAHEYDALCLVDGAQTAGVLSLDIGKLGVDFFAFAGHKGPLAPQGIGGLYVAPHVSLASPAAVCELPRVSEEKVQCSNFPSYCDVGSVNMAGLVGLSAGLSWIQENNYREKTKQLTQYFLNGLAEIPKVSVYGSKNVDNRTSAISITLAGYSPQEVENTLKMRASIVSRSGHHCAPMAHESIGTAQEGTLRFSTGYANTKEEIDVVLNELTKL